MPAVAEPRAKFDLKEALREIHIIAGLDPTNPRDSASHKPLAVGVTSPTYGDGKTTVSIALAASLSEDFEADVTLVDADFHTQSIGGQFGLDGETGLSDVLLGKVPLQSVTHRVAQARMNVVAAGSTPQDPARIARSEHLTTLIDNMKRANKYVVIDLPAALHSMNAPVLAKRCDGVIIVVRAGRTTQSDLERTLHLLSGANVLGVVVNRKHSAVPTWVRRTLNMRG